jgi:hypothetical protein
VRCLAWEYARISWLSPFTGSGLKNVHESNTACRN